MSRNINYYKEMDKAHITKNLISGAKSGVISQFLADIFISFLLLSKGEELTDIKLSEIESYYASVASGITVGVLAIYLDSFAVVIFSTIAYEFTFNLVSYLNNNTTIDFDATSIIFDSIVVIILIYLFDPVAHNQYLRYREKRYSDIPSHKRMNRSMAQSIFFIVLINTYNFIDLEIKRSKKS